jgi:TRAP-type C4-dicarboxylate transport system permease small subunit
MYQKVLRKLYKALEPFLDIFSYLLVYLFFYFLGLGGFHFYWLITFYNKLFGISQYYPIDVLRFFMINSFFYLLFNLVFIYFFGKNITEIIFFSKFSSSRLQKTTRELLKFIMIYIVPILCLFGIVKYTDYTG